jgi:hypothetical protein
MSQSAADSLPKFEDGKTYLLKGSTLNAIIAAIRAAQIVAVEGLEIERTPEGVILRVK